MKKKTLLLTAVAMLGLTTSALAQNVPNYVPINGLVGWWPFNGNANDESGNGNNGTINGATLTTDRFGVVNNAFGFDGINSFIEIINSNSIQPANAISISAWTLIEPNQSFGNFTRIISKIQSEPQNFATYQLITGASSELGKTGVTIRTGSGNSQLTQGVYAWSGTNSNNIVSQWQHIVGTYDGSTLKFYQNGILISETAITGGLFYDSGNLWFGKGKSGAFAPGSDIFFKGKIDDIGIWNRALTECEIADLYNTQLGSLNSSSTQTETALDSYTWPVNGLTYSQSGNYIAVILNSAGCDSTITLDLTLSFTGMEESESIIYSIFPNPSKDFITLEVDVALIGKEYVLFDEMGRKIKSGILSSENTKVSLIDMPDGIYNVSVDNKEKQSFRIIKE
jgi:hypothetical protein